MKPNCMILRYEESSFHWAASIKSIYSKKPMITYYSTKPQSPWVFTHRYLHIMKGEKSPRLSGQVLPGYSLLITSRHLAGWIVLQAALRRFLYAPSLLSSG
ncbi:hypothetical protein EXD76_01465 [BEV proteobacterium]|nr:hypothetical protein [Candidatus Symbiopectobacterium sp. Chty_BC]